MLRKGGGSGEVGRLQSRQGVPMPGGGPWPSSTSRWLAETGRPGSPIGTCCAGHGHAGGRAARIAADDIPRLHHRAGRGWLRRSPGRRERHVRPLSGLIVRCSGASDVIDAANLVCEHELLTAVDGGGDDVAELCICHDALLIDLSAMRGVWVDAVRALCGAGPGRCHLGCRRP